VDFNEKGDSSLSGISDLSEEEQTVSPGTQWRNIEERILRQEKKRKKIK